MRISTLVKLFMCAAAAMGFINIVIMIANGEATFRAVFMSSIAVGSMLVGFSVILYKIKPLTDLAAMIKDVKHGNMNVKLNRSKIKTDEVGVLMLDIYDMVDMNRRLITDIDKLVDEFELAGNIEYRIDESKYEGSYRKMIEHLDEFAGHYVKDLHILTGLLDRIGKGDFDLKIERFPGKKSIVNEKVDALVRTLRELDVEVDDMLEAAAVKGDLAFHLDASKYQGGWSTFVIGLNKFAEAVDSPIVEIRDVMANLAQGKFDKKVSSGYRGDFKAISDAVNNTIDTLSGYVTEISKVLQAISAGDLTLNIKRDYVGNFHEIKSSINNISENLRKSMSDISMAAKYVLEGANKITSSAVELADGSAAQAASLEELNTSVEMIKLQTKQFAQNADEANHLSTKSTENARVGNDAMQQMLEAMMQIKDSSSNISQIIRVIQDIAFQTNLLSLNAAVEAARAGEHGKGFGVVAEEVRSLASRSSGAAAETTMLIQDSINRVDSGSEVAQTTSDSLGTIVSDANEVRSLINNISQAANDQAEMIAQISSTLLDTATTVQNNSKFAHESAATAEELNSQSEMLLQLVAYFRLQR